MTTNCRMIHDHIPAKPSHNGDIVSVHFNNFYCTEICNKLRRDLAMATYIYLFVDECCLTSYMPQQRHKLQMYLNYSNNEHNAFSLCVIDGHVSFKMVGVHIHILVCILFYILSRKTFLCI